VLYDLWTLNAQVSERNHRKASPASGQAQPAGFFVGASGGSPAAA
jgi:hypothetical protein